MGRDSLFRPQGTAGKQKSIRGLPTQPPTAKLPAQGPGVRVPGALGLPGSPSSGPESTTLPDPGFRNPGFIFPLGPLKALTPPASVGPSPSPRPLPSRALGQRIKDRFAVAGLPGLLIRPFPQLPPIVPDSRVPGTFSSSSGRLCLAVSFGLCEGRLGRAPAAPPAPRTASSGVRAAGAGDAGPGEGGGPGRRGRGFRGR